jgi:hypothetical protein
VLLWFPVQNKVIDVLEGLLRKGKAIEGIVREAQSKDPLVGVSVCWEFIFGNVSVVTDAHGRYRIEPVIRAPTYTLLVRDNAQRPIFLNERFEVKDTPGLEPVHFDCAVHRGVLLTGKVKDKTTGEGVQAFFRVAPLQDNEFFKPEIYANASPRDRLLKRTQDNGSFAVATIPGKLLVVVSGTAPKRGSDTHFCPYRAAQPDMSAFDKASIIGNPELCLVKTARGVEYLTHAYSSKVIDIPAEAQEYHVELELDPGQTIRIKIVDEQGAPVCGAYVNGLADSISSAKRLSADTATVYGLGPGKQRRIIVLHPWMNLGAQAQITGNEPAPVTIKLEPTGTISGQFLDADGNPIAAADVSILPDDHVAQLLYHQVSHETRAFIVKTDARGCFTLENIIPGIAYYIHAETKQMSYTGEGPIDTRDLLPGQTKEIGSRRITGRKI